jgi:hypothetical protein
MRYLGFDEQGVMLRDSGGTIFSDMLMGNRYVISADGNLNSTVYHLLPNQSYEYNGEHYYIYEYNYTLPFVQVLDGAVDIEKMYETDTPDWDIDLIATQNELYHKFFGDLDSNIIQKLGDTEITVEPLSGEGMEKFRKVTVPASALNNFYLHLTNMERKDIAYYLTEEDFANFDMETYKDEFVRNIFMSNIGVGRLIGRGLFDLGTFDSEQTFYILADEEAFFDGLYVAELDISKLAEISTSTNNYTKFENTKTGIKLTINGTAGQKVFIPLTNLTGATATINGSAVDIDLALNAYIAIDLVDGENNIEIIFTPMNLRMGIMVTIATLILLLILFLLNRFLNIGEKPWAQWIGVAIGGIIFLAVAYLVFAKPLALTIITDILRIGA